MGYSFPGQRCACYSSDLLLRQYKRIRLELGKSFTYKEIQKVYTIVLFEKSSAAFHKFSDEIYIHHFEQKSDTGMEMDLLQEYTFICLDIFNSVIHNEGREIENRCRESVSSAERASRCRRRRGEASEETAGEITEVIMYLYMLIEERENNYGF